MSSWYAALLAGPAVLLPLAGYALFRPRVKGARWYALLLVTIAWWSLAYAGELAVHGLEAKVLALKIKYLAVAALPPAWIAFILEFVGSPPRSVRTRVTPLALVAAAVTATAWTDGWHHLFWGGMRLRDLGSYTVLQGRGPLFFLNVSYSYVVLGAGLALLVLHAVHSPYLYRKRAIVLIVGTIVPWVGNFMFLLQVDEAIDPTPFLFACTAVVAAVAVFRYDLFEPVPTLRDARIESVGDGVIILDGHARIADLNAAAAAMVGWSRAEVAGSRLDELVEAWPAGPVPSTPFDLQVDTASGLRIVDVRCNAVRSRAGHPTGTVVVLRDVTDHRAAEMALRESEARYRAVIEQAFDGVWLTDRNGLIVDVNPQACALLECPREKMVGQRPDHCAASATWTVPVDEHAVDIGEAVPWEMVLEVPSGRRVVLAGRSRRVSTDLVVSTFRDVTEEHAQTQLRERLLVEAQTANKLKDDFLATVSHELRTPLNAVVGWTHILRRQMDEATLTHALAAIERNALAQARLVEDLLDLSGLAGGRTRLELRPSSLADIVTGAVEAVQPTAAAKGVSLEVELSPDVPPLVADPDRLRQVLWNLLANAIKFTPPSGKVAVRAQALDGEVELSVRDTGVGIDPAFLPHVFDAYRQASAGERRKPRGIGLGLTIVRRIVEAHGGRVEAESAGPGLGATFRFVIPIRAEPAADAPAGAEENGKSAPVRPNPRHH